MREDGRDSETTEALDVHKEGARGRHEGLTRSCFHVSWFGLMGKERCGIRKVGGGADGGVIGEGRGEKGSCEP